jgi:thiol-disulfide isomerase/thioredoxin
MMFTRSFSVACFSLLLGIAPFSIAASDTLKNMPNAGDKAPDKLGTDFYGKEVKLSDYKGTVVVVSFWASWCGPCLKEIPVLEEMQRKVAESELRVISINTESRDQYRKLARRNSDWKMLFAHDSAKEASDLFGVKGLPHMVIIERDGTIKKVHRGYGDGMIPVIAKEIAQALTTGIQKSDKPGVQTSNAN